MQTVGIQGVAAVVHLDSATAWEIYFGIEVEVNHYFGILSAVIVSKSRKFTQDYVS